VDELLDKRAELKSLAPSVVEAMIQPRKVEPPAWILAAFWFGGWPEVE
jgi:hypothetical protein